MTTEGQKLTIVADTCESIPSDQMNNDVAFGVAFAVGYMTETSSRRKRP